jgi:hypothetical protein
MTLSLGQRFSLLFWWVIAFGITIYLFLGAVNTIMVILE